MENKFSSVLNSDEKIIRIERANVTGGVLKYSILSIIEALVVSLIVTPFLSTMLNNKVAIFIITFISVVALFSIAGFLKTKMYYVCLTNKRVVVRTGVFTTNFKSYAIEKVTGNITVMCNQLIFDKTDASSCSIKAKIELMPVGHGDIDMSILSITNGYTFAKELERVVKENAQNMKMIVAD